MAKEAGGDDTDEGTGKNAGVIGRMGGRDQKKVDEDYELFLRDIEEDDEMRAAVNLYKSQNDGSSAGAGNYGMCGRAYSPRFLWSWPSAKTSVMGAEQLSSVMAAVGKKVDPELKERIERESEVTFGTARLWDDGVIPPSHTRRVLGMGLQAAMTGNVESKKTTFGVFRM